MRWYVPERHICADPHEPYVEVLRQFGYEAHHKNAIEALSLIEAEAIYFLDVIEHMDRDLGTRVIELALSKPHKQIVIYTPIGFVEQREDCWGLGGEYWQTHRSGWMPADFPGWTIETFKREGFFAIHE
jgi:hypothetical protein